MTEIQKSIIKTLTYFSIFKHPLKIDELHRYLLFQRCAIDDLKKEANELKDIGKIFEIENFYLIENDKNWILNRYHGEKLASKFWKIAQLMAHLMKRFPFVRGIFISGSLAKWNVTIHTDIDFFIITKPRRLWMTRSALIAFKKIFLFNSKKFFCLNYFITDDHLEIEDKNIFTAIEIASIKPIFNFDLYLKFLEANSWIKNFVPNFVPAQLPNLISKRFPVSKLILEKLVEISFNKNTSSLDDFDLFLMNKWEKIWQKRYPHLTNEERDLMFRCRPYVSKAHPNNFQNFVLTNYEEKLKIFLNDSAHS
ncbi:MAG: hypothetical protein NZ923_00035 [Candidatus Kryptonium sp.]|nr:hypothetical protein [Candidatus Kryptonium sp.]